MSLRSTIWTTTLLLAMFSGVYAYATLGEGRRKSAKRKAELRFSNRVENTPGTFSLRSGYVFRGNSVLGAEERTTMRINTVVSMQKGNNIYTMPLKKDVLINKVKVSLGNQSLRRF